MNTASYQHNQVAAFPYTYDPQNTTVFVGGLPGTATAEDLKKYMSY
jgi:hypothetical protein